MKNYIYQKINWNDFDKYFEKNFFKYVKEIQTFYDKADNKYSILNFKFYSSYFFFSISEIIFNKYLHSKKIFYIIKKYKFKDRLFNFLIFNKTNNKSYETFNYFLLNLKTKNLSNKIIEDKFFYRHNEFKKEFKKKIKNFKELNFKNKSKKKYIQYKKTHLNNLKKNFTFNISKNFIIELLTLEKNFDNFVRFKYPKVFMSGQHGYGHDIIHRLFISFSKIFKCKIFMIQANFWQGLLSFYDNNKYESIVSDKYFAHGKNLNINKYVPIGSFYSYKSNINGSKKQSKNVIILTEPPDKRRIYPKLLSMDWSNTYQEFLEDETRFFDIIKNILSRDSNCDLLCKDQDYKFYLKKFKKHNIKTTILKKSFVNKKSYKIKNYKKVYLTYPSIAFVEHFYAGSKIIFAFPKVNLILKKSSLLNKFYSKNNFSKTIKKYAYPTNPKIAFKKIKKYF